MTTSPTFRAIALLSLAVLALTGCGGSGEDTASSEAGGDAAAESGAVTIADLKFAPGDVSVAAGSEVTWTNDDSAPHTVTFDDDAAESSEELKPGDTFSTTFDEAGSYSYTCAIHPDMTGKVTVQ